MAAQLAANSGSLPAASWRKFRYRIRVSPGSSVLSTFSISVWLKSTLAYIEVTLAFSSGSAESCSYMLSTTCCSMRFSALRSAPPSQHQASGIRDAVPTTTRTNAQPKMPSQSNLSFTFGLVL